MGNSLKTITSITLLGCIWIGSLSVSSFTNSRDTIVNNIPTPHIITLRFPAYFGHHYQIPEDNPTTEEGIALGRMLFYEKQLSKNNQISCASCHQQEHAFSDTAAFSLGADGSAQPRNTMALVNLLWVNQFFWDGRAKGLEAQADTPLVNLHEMNQSFDQSIAKLEHRQLYKNAFKVAFGDEKITKSRIEKALAQFERTLISCNSRYDQYLEGIYQPTAAELEGIALFYGTPTSKTYLRRPSCSHCHGGPNTYEELFMNNGLDSLPKDLGRAIITGQDYDKGRFRVVTLRNIALTAPYMHDGRFKSLAEVIDHYSDHILSSSSLSPFLNSKEIVSNPKDHLSFTKGERTSLIAFLNMLTDSSFIQDKRFSDPFTSNK
ncbi:cytochrome c peroxidase [Arachidicoccus rhizosphaerae]|uniref:Methylamine utilization protein MauG n=1 Tax=Arachidicoccus rhizosphaerae TaxID=551991 RepID=A0A1H3WUY3_9BACT|nr:cytochrome c peroxidase [Arachidicoccus rhizosphaerae]SDZ90780.1 cytochrome c peroxidase [Arachidicoccus rhizosphaerae]